MVCVSRFGIGFLIWESFDDNCYDIVFDIKIECFFERIGDCKSVGKAEVYFRAGPIYEIFEMFQILKLSNFKYFLPKIYFSKFLFKVNRKLEKKFCHVF